MPLGTEVGLGPGEIVLDGDPAAPKTGTVRQFLAHVRCDQMGKWIKMSLCTEEGLTRGDFVLDGDPAPQKKGHSPQFLANVYCGQTVAHLSYYSA